MKQKRIRKEKYESNDTKEVKTLIYITIGVLIVALGLYFLTDLISSKETKSNVKFDYDTILVSSMFDRSEEKYYVFMYSSKDENASQYNALLTNYLGKEDALKVYYIDTNLAFNSYVNSDKSNNLPTKPDEVQINGSALVLIENGKVAKYYESISDYENVLN